MKSFEVAVKRGVLICISLKTNFLAQGGIENTFFSSEQMVHYGQISTIQELKTSKQLQGIPWPVSDQDSVLSLRAHVRSLVRRIQIPTAAGSLEAKDNNKILLFRNK